jgi:hypothetical protein
MHGFKRGKRVQTLIGTVLQRGDVGRDGSELFQQLAAGRGKSGDGESNQKPPGRGALLRKFPQIIARSDAPRSGAKEMIPRLVQHNTRSMKMFLRPQAKRGLAFACGRGNISWCDVVDEQNAPFGAEIWGKAATLPYLLLVGRSCRSG